MTHPVYIIIMNSVHYLKLKKYWKLGYSAHTENMHKKTDSITFPKRIEKCKTVNTNIVIIFNNFNNS